MLSVFAGQRDAFGLKIVQLLFGSIFQLCLWNIGVKMQPRFQGPSLIPPLDFSSHGAFSGLFRTVKDFSFAAVEMHSS
jgi:hypothetical protein